MKQIIILLIVFANYIFAQDNPDVTYNIDKDVAGFNISGKYSVWYKKTLS